MAREVEVLGGLLDRPARPFVAVVGGSKVADKLGVLRALAPNVDVLAVAGAWPSPSWPLWVTTSGPRWWTWIGSRTAGGCSTRGPDPAAHRRGGARARGDVRARRRGTGHGDAKVLERDLPDGWTGLDIGPETAAAFADEVSTAGTVLWNGPVGVFEDERFAEGTRRVAQAVADCPGFTVVGGGDSASALDHLGLADQIDFLSTGGGASLEFIELEGDLPGLDALRQAPNAPRG